MNDKMSRHFYELLEKLRAANIPYIVSQHKDKREWHIITNYDEPTRQVVSDLTDPIYFKMSFPSIDSQRKIKIEQR